MANIREHRYEVSVIWTGNQGEGTRSLRSYGRDNEISGPDKPTIPGSSDPAFRGDPGRWNPEELLVATLSQCHMLWLLYLAAEAGVVVTRYRDIAEGTMLEEADGSGRFAEVVLRPQVTVATADMVEGLMSLHQRAHRLCFIANSVNFPVRCEPETTHS